MAGRSRFAFTILALASLFLFPLPAPRAQAGRSGTSPAGKDAPSPLPSDFRAWERALRRAGNRLAPSLVALHVWQTPFAPPGRATGVVVRPGFLVTLGEAVEGADMVLGEPLVGEGYSLPLEIRGFSGGLAVLSYPVRSIPGMKPVVSGGKLPSPGSMVLLAFAGSPGDPPPVYFLPIGRVHRLGGEGKSGAGEPVLHLPVLFPGGEARGALVSNSSLEAVGLLVPRAIPRWFALPPLARSMVKEALERGGEREEDLSRVIPLGRVFEAVKEVLKRAGKGGGKREKKRFTLGVVLLPDLVVEHVIAGSPAQKGGLKKGDRITHFAGLPVDSLSAFKKVFSRSRWSKKVVSVGYVRGGTEGRAKIRFP